MDHAGLQRTVACVLALFLAAPLAAGEPFRYPEGKYGKGELKYISGLPVLTVTGSPEEIGAAVGALALKPGWRMALYPEELIKHYHLRPLWRPLVIAGDKMVEGFPADYRAELEAMARSSGVGRERLVVGNTLFDLKKILACSALLVEPGRSATGGPLLGRNLDYPALHRAHEYSLVTVCKARGARHAFASVGFPGLVGCLSGINDAGLSLAVLEVFQVRIGKKWFDASGTPYALCYRRILEQCSTIAEARALLEKMNRTTTTNLVLADPQGVAVFEVTPSHVVVREARRGTCVCTNHYCSDRLRPWVPINWYQTFDRFGALEKCAAQGERLSVEDLHHGLHAASNPDETMQTMVFEPGKLRLHLAIGRLPASAGEFKVLDLAPLLRGAPSFQAANGQAARCQPLTPFQK
jgi:hypothetical protein